MNQKPIIVITDDKGEPIGYAQDLPDEEDNGYQPMPSILEMFFQ